VRVSEAQFVKPIQRDIKTTGQAKFHTFVDAFDFRVLKRFRARKRVQECRTSASCAQATVDASRALCASRFRGMLSDALAPPAWNVSRLVEVKTAQLTPLEASSSIVDGEVQKDNLRQKLRDIPYFSFLGGSLKTRYAFQVFSCRWTPPVTFRLQSRAR
jgi:hypothetical protein